MNLFNKDYWRRALHDPIVAAGLAVDLIPVFGVAFFGWGAAALVMLYWLENLVIGVFTLGRVLVAAVASSGLAGLALGGFISAFFTVHYGMFCMGHGFFLMSFLPELDAPPGFGAQALVGMVLDLFAHWPMLKPAVFVLAAWQAFVFATDDLEYAREHGAKMNPVKEMFAPYGRIMVLHIGVFAGAFALVGMGDPMIGVLGLILFRALIGIVVNQYRRARRFEAVAGTV